MKTISLMCALAGIMTVMCANALTTEEIMARCQSSQETVWDSLNNTCVPNNPCKKNGYDSYCNRFFAEGKLSSPRTAEMFTKAYAKYTDGQEAHCYGLDGHYISCNYNNGHYVVFEFNDLAAQDKEFLPESVTHFAGSTEKGCFGDSNIAGSMAHHNLLPDLCILDKAPDSEAAYYMKGCTGDYNIGQTAAFNAGQLLKMMHDIENKYYNVEGTCTFNADYGDPNNPEEKGFCITLTCI